MAIIDTITTIAEVCGLQGHNMNTLTSVAGARIFPDATIEYVINNVIRFVYGNTGDDVNANLELWAINWLSVQELNNIMHNARQLPEWEYYDTFNKEAFNAMMESKKTDDNAAIDVIYTLRSQYDDVVSPY